MVNFGLNSASILGIFLALGGAGFYFMRYFRPELSRNHDIFFVAIGLLCGFILVFQGWRLDPVLQFGQFLLAASMVLFAVETVRLRLETAHLRRVIRELRHQLLEVDLDKNLGLTAHKWQIFQEQLDPKQRNILNYKQQRRVDTEISEILGISLKELQNSWFKVLDIAWEIRNPHLGNDP